MIRVVIFVAVFLFSVCTFARTWVVAKKSSVKSIKSAIELAAKGDTIRIMKGIYKEGNLVIQKSIVVIGIDYPVLDGENKYEIFTIAANGVSIIGLRMINTGVGSINDISAISAIEAKRLRVLNNQFENTFFGIQVEQYKFF